MNRILIPCVCMALATGAFGGQGATSSTSGLEQALSKAGSNARPLQDLLSELPAEQKAGAAFLIEHMPERDLTSIDKALLSSNIALAYQAKASFPWGRDIPEDIFLNDVLPYAVVDETRENWRQGFFDLFGKLVHDSKSIRDAVLSINSKIGKLTGVDYNTLREKPNQSPSESIRQHMASCTGLAILLVDAFRSVGIPARFAGTASWHDDRGNHSWVEVWMDGKWYITEYYMPRQLDHPWFLANAGKANPDNRQYAIYATSFKQTGESFPMVWNDQSQEVHAVNVSQRYIDTCEAMEEQAVSQGTHVPVSIRIFKNSGSNSNSGDRVAVNVDVFDGQLQMNGGRTSGPLQDMNDVLTFLLEKNKTYTFRYQDASGNTKDITATVKDSPMTVDATFE